MLILRKAYQEMIKVYKSVNEDTIDIPLGMTPTAIENRVYGKKDQDFKVSTALHIQELSKTTLFAEAIAQVSGGVFIKLPEHNDFDRDELLNRFNSLYAEVGNLSKKFIEYTSDDEIDKKEKQDLTDVGHKVHKDVQELLSLTFAIYCRNESNE